MRYLFVANQEPLQGYTEFCNNTYLALFCETRRNGYNGFPNEYEKKEQLCLIGDEVSFSQDYSSLGEEMCFSPVPRTHTLIVWDRSNLAQILNGLEYSPRVVVLSELLEILTNNYINSFEYNLCIHNGSLTMYAVQKLCLQVVMLFQALAQRRQILKWLNQQSKVVT